MVEKLNAAVSNVKAIWTLVAMVVMTIATGATWIANIEAGIISAKSRAADELARFRLQYDGDVKAYESAINHERWKAGKLEERIGRMEDTISDVGVLRSEIAGLKRSITEMGRQVGDLRTFLMKRSDLPRGPPG